MSRSFMFPSAGDDTVTMSYEHPSFPRFLPGDPTEPIREVRRECVVEPSGDAHDRSVSRSRTPRNGPLHSFLPRFVPDVAVGFGIYKAIVEAGRDTPPAR